MKRLLLPYFLFSCLVFLSISLHANDGQHPLLLISKSEGKLIKKKLAKLPLLQQSFNDAKSLADKAIAEKIDVPVPKDPAGGYTHDRHKNNYSAMYHAGLVYTITGEEKYAKFVSDMLLQYAQLIPTLNNHPHAKGSSPGRLFHQALNDANWLVYTSQAYDCIYNYLSSDQRKTIENGAFRPLTNYLTQDLEQWFNLLHNHGVWACAAVGMTGLAIDDDNLVQMALYGTHKDGKSGFIAQLNHLFSPDGYYTEGPYYARYALLPFYIFAQAIENNKPQLNIFQHRNQILKKALYAALQQTNTNGAFFPINDAIKDKTYVSGEIVLAANTAFKQYKNDPALLDIADKQNRVLLNSSGVAVAEAIKNYKGKLPGFAYNSVEYTDGSNGKEGGVTILRATQKSELTTLLFKYAAHGLSHGHYDKLNILLYDNGNEVLQDYGAARFLNVEQKDGGRYLTENKTFAMQTIAHNTIVVDEASHYNGKESVAEAHHPYKRFSVLDGEVQVASAVDNAAYKGVNLQRTIFMINESKDQKPVSIDLFKATSANNHQYDLPFWYKGQLIETSFQYTPATQTLTPLGDKNGYQHIWKEAHGKADGSIGTLTFLNGSSYYSITTNADKETEFLLGRAGAADPNFNLRREATFIVRKKGRDQLFVSVIEPHGNFNPLSEASSDSKSSVKDIITLKDDAQYSVVKVTFHNNKEWLLMVANGALEKDQHQVTVSGKKYTWTGPYNVVKFQ